MADVMAYIPLKKKILNDSVSRDILVTKTKTKAYFKTKMNEKFRKG